MMVTSYFLLNIGGYEIDSATAALITALVALITTLAVSVLNATYLEKKRQKVDLDFEAVKQQVQLNYETSRRREQLKTEKDALRDALYTEIIWKIREIGISLGGRFGLLNHADDRKKLEEALSSFKTCPVYDSALKTPTLFYQIDDARGIAHFYRNIRALPEDAAFTFEFMHQLITKPNMHTEKYMENLDKLIGDEAGGKLREWLQTIRTARNQFSDEKRYQEEVEKALKDLEGEMVKSYKGDSLRSSLNNAVSQLDMGKLHHLKDVTAEKAIFEPSKKGFQIIDELCFQKAT